MYFCMHANRLWTNPTNPVQSHVLWTFCKNSEATEAGLGCMEDKTAEEALSFATPGKSLAGTEKEKYCANANPKTAAPKMPPENTYKHLDIVNNTQYAILNQMALLWCCFVPKLKLTKNWKNENWLFMNLRQHAFSILWDDVSMQAEIRAPETNTETIILAQTLNSTETLESAGGQQTKQRTGDLVECEIPREATGGPGAKLL